MSYLFGVYQGIWRYTSLPDIQRIVFSVLAGTVAVAARRCTPRASARSSPTASTRSTRSSSCRSCPGSRMAVRSFKEWSLYGRGGEGDSGHRAGGRGRGRGPAEGALAQPGVARGGPPRRRPAEARPAAARACASWARSRTCRASRRRLKVRHAIIAMPSVPYQVRRRVVEICKRAQGRGAHRALARQRGRRQARRAQDPQGGGRGPHEARARDARRRGPARAAHGQGGAGHRRRRLDRLRAVPADRRTSSPRCSCSSSRASTRCTRSTASCARAFPRCPWRAWSAT